MTTWLDLESIILSEVSQTERDKYCMGSFMWNLKQKSKTHRNSRKLSGAGGGHWENRKKLVKVYTKKKSTF